ncbi:MAG: rod shape-determining protein MreC, partial [Myxococcota bacterium]
VVQMTRTADVEPGDVLLTSGVGGVFPKGLKVGTVVSLERRSFGLYQNAKLEPGVNFRRLEEVLVITGDWGGDVSFEPEANPVADEGPGDSPVAKTPAPLEP